MTCWFGERLHYMALGFHTYDLYPTDLLVSSVLWHKCQSGFLLSCNTSMMTSSNGNIFRVTGPLCGEFTGPGEFPTQRPVTRSFDVYFDLGPNEWLSKQWRRWWFKIPSRSLWRHCNDSPCKWCCESWNARLPTQPTEEWKLEMHAIKRIKSYFFLQNTGAWCRRPRPVCQVHLGFGLCAQPRFLTNPPWPWVACPGIRHRS